MTTTIAKNHASGLSKLQKLIVRAIADHTVNTYADDYMDSLQPNNPMRDGCVSCATIAGECYSPEADWQSQKVSFSRAVRSLIFERDLVEGYALGWIIVTKKSPGGDGYPRWQGGGRRARDKQFPVCRDPQPRLKLLGLTELGWQVAEQLQAADDAQTQA